MKICAANPLSESPDGSYRDMNLDYRRGELLEINQRIFFSIRTDDQRIRLLEANYSEPVAPFRYLAEYWEFESASHVAGWFYWSIGRLTDGSLILFDRLDEMEGRTLILSTDRSDVEAVADWITDLNHIFDDYQVNIHLLAIHIVKEGNSIKFLSEFNDEASETLEIGFSIDLGEAELDELWPMLETGK